MIFTQPLSFITEFVEELDQGIRKWAPNRKLSTIQRYWLSFCLMGILLSNQVCWATFERVGLGGYSQAALSWMFRHSKLLWPLLLHVSIVLILNEYNIKEGELVGDDSDRQRAKITKRIFAASKIFDKKTGGWFNSTIKFFILTRWVPVAHVMHAAARYFNDGVGSSRPKSLPFMCLAESRKGKSRLATVMI